LLPPFFATAFFLGATTDLDFRLLILGHVRDLRWFGEGYLARL
jgi:hypothetical protein